MTDPTCQRCGKPLADGAIVCRRDAQELAERLREAAGHAEDAWTVLSGLARYGTAGRGGTGESPAPNLRASTDFGKASDTVGRWGQRLLDDTDAPEPEAWTPALGPLCAPRRPADGPPEPGKPWLLCVHPSCTTIRRPRPSALAEACTWLAGQVEWLRRHEAAGEAFKELHDACRQLERLVDKPADNRHFIGICNCGKALYAPWDWTVIQCRDRTCGAVWNLADGQDILMRHLDDKLVTAAEATRFAGHLDPNRSADAVRKLIEKWVAHGQLLAHGYVTDDDGTVRPRYRFSEIRSKLAETPRRNREGAAA